MAPLPEEWFNITDGDNITEIISIKPQPTEASPSATTELPGDFTQELLETLKDVGCPKDCSGNGKCIKGMYSCYACFMIYVNMQM